MTLEDEMSNKLRACMIRDGICPDCGKRLDPPKLPTVITKHADAYKRVRTCYDCEETFIYSLDEN